MDANHFLGLLVEAVGPTTFRKSFLIDAINFRVGTCFSNFFRPSSIGSSL
jgi:hypothetical protein